MACLNHQLTEAFLHNLNTSIFLWVDNYITSLSISTSTSLPSRALWTEYLPGIFIDGILKMLFCEPENDGAKVGDYVVDITVHQLGALGLEVGDPCKTVVHNPQ
jgi:hypothetical protein